MFTETHGSSTAWTRSSSAFATQQASKGENDHPLFHTVIGYGPENPANQPRVNYLTLLDQSLVPEDPVRVVSRILTKFKPLPQELIDFPQALPLFSCWQRMHEARLTIDECKTTLNTIGDNYKLLQAWFEVPEGVRKSQASDEFFRTWEELFGLLEETVKNYFV